MLTAEQKANVLEKAYIPEHSVDLISEISGGEPFLVNNCLVHWKQGELILNGYPLTGEFDVAKFEAITEHLRRRFRPARISYIAPQRPFPLAAATGETASDDYFSLDLQDVRVPPPVRRNLRNASRHLTIENAVSMDSSHQQLMEEFIARVNPGSRVKRLLKRMPAYVESGSGGIVLNAKDRQHRLNAFYIADLAPVHFCTYIIGCYSRRHYITGASDLLMDALIRLSRQHAKTMLHLGLGINEGLRRFKGKWGAVACRPYRMGTVDLKYPTILTGIREFLKQL